MVIIGNGANSGTTPGRYNVSSLINIVTLAGGTTAAMTTITAGTYKEILITSRTTGGMIISNPVTMRINADSGANYDALSLYAQGALTISANASLGATSAQLALTASVATVPDMRIDVSLLPLVVSGSAREFTCSFFAKGSAAGTYISGTTNGSWNDTTNGLTDIVLTFGNAATGTVEFRGIPA